MYAIKKGGSLAALLVAGFMILGAACGGSSSNSSDSSGSTSAESSSATTAVSSGGGGVGDCAELFKMSEELATAMTSNGMGMTGDVSSSMSASAKALEAFSSQAPSEIRDDWKTLVAGFNAYAQALEGINFNNLTDPATMEKLNKATEAIDDSKMQNASDNINAWIEKNCPSLAGK